MSKTYWLASYPKSGNTWFRIFLNNLLHEEETPVLINDLPVSSNIASARQPFDLGLGLKSSDLLMDEIDCLRPRVDELLDQESKKLLFRKIHDAYLNTPAGEPIVSRQASAGVIYLLRNPLDVAVSYAHHGGRSLDATIEHMLDPDFATTLQQERLPEQFRQILTDWSGHVRSWTEQQDIPVCVLRYEDLLSNPVAHFTRAVRFAGLDYSSDDISVAIEASRFDKLKQQEEQDGRFKEAPPRATSHFFRKGQAGDWKNHLNPAQVQKIIAGHGETMQHWGYALP